MEVTATTIDRCRGQNNSPWRYPWNLWICYATWQREWRLQSQESGCWSADFKIGRLSWISSLCNHKSPSRWKRKENDSELERWQNQKTWPNIAGFENGRSGPWAKKCGWQGMWPSWKGQGIDFPLEPPEENAAVVTLTQPSETYFRLWASVTIR